MPQRNEHIQYNAIASGELESSATAVQMPDISIRSDISDLNCLIASLVAAREVGLRADVPELSNPLAVLVPDLVRCELEHSDVASSEVIKSYAEEKALAKVLTPSFSLTLWADFTRPAAMLSSTAYCLSSISLR